MIWVFVLLCLFYLSLVIISEKNHNLPTAIKNSTEQFAILIPARDESKVIEDLLQSIKQQTKPILMENVYVIVESIDDPTVEICKKYNATVFIRKKRDLQRKGYALDECIQEIYHKNYDAYFIFDADNILDKDYIQNMIPIYKKGYDIGVGYRNIKNGKKVIPSTSALIFSIINTLTNEIKTKDTRNITLSGTGFFINGKWIQKWRGFPFHELTEDYELYLYSIVHNMTSFYNKESIFYDEQPNTFKQSFTQRKRWIKGYINSRQKYIKAIRKSIQKKDPNIASKILEIIGLLPIVIPILWIVGIFIYHLSFDLKLIVIDLLITYTILMIFTIYILIREKKNLKIEDSIKWKVVVYHPFFLISYIPCFFAALMNKDMKWEKIEHSEKQ